MAMLVVKKNDTIYAKVDYEKREQFRKIVKGATWDGTNRAWSIPATISTFRNLRQFDPEAMSADKLSPGIRAWYNELITRATRLDELQKGIPDAKQGIPEVPGPNGCSTFEGDGLRGVRGTCSTSNAEYMGNSGYNKNTGVAAPTTPSTDNGEADTERAGSHTYSNESGNSGYSSAGGVGAGEHTEHVHDGPIRGTNGSSTSGDYTKCTTTLDIPSGSTSSGSGTNFNGRGVDAKTIRAGGGGPVPARATDGEGENGKRDANGVQSPQTGNTTGVLNNGRDWCSRDEHGETNEGGTGGLSATHKGGTPETRVNSDENRPRGHGPEPIVFPESFRFAVPPFRHQREAIAYCINLRKAALWLDLGLGKTYTSINVARYRNQFNGVTRVLVVAPRSLLQQWKGEVSKYAGIDTQTIIIEGTPRRKRQLLEEVANSSKFIFAVITYESVSALRNEIADTNFHMFILDESTKIKNPKAARTKATVEVCKQIPYGLELTGLAYLNNPVDLYSQFLALDETVYGSDQWQFSEHYIDWVKAPFGRMMRGLRHVDELKRRAYFIAFSRSKKDCLDLPDKTYVTRALPMYDTQKVWYDKLSQECLEEVAKNDVEEADADTIPQEVNVTNVLTKLEKLQQVTAGFVIKDDGETVWFDSPKYAEICDIVQESTESFIIWARHTEAMKRIGQALLQRNIVSEELSRYTSTHRRNMAIKQFKEGRLRVLVCQLQSESKGLDLTCQTNSVNAIYLENTFSIDDRWQSESRQHRIGMKGTATYIDMVLEDTVDEHVLEILKGKFKISEYIAKMGLEIVLGKGGSIATRKSRSKKQLPTPEDHVEFDDESLEGIEGFEDLVSIARKKKKGAG